MAINSPHRLLPWQLPGADDALVALTANTLSALLPAAFSMAMLGAIELLLCAVVLGGMTGKKHQSNNKLIGQGIGNVLVPFFGGIFTATAAHRSLRRQCARGATSSVSELVHALLYWCWRQRSPGCRCPPWRPCLLVAWNMSEAQ